MTDELSPPRAPARPTVLRAHDDERVDPWFWLCERDNPEVLDYLRAENAYTEAALAPSAALRDTLFDGDRRSRAGDRRDAAGAARARGSTSPAPSKACSTTCTAAGPRARPGCPTRSRRRAPRPASRSCSTRTCSRGDHDYFAVGDLTVSTDHSLVAYTTDITGGERYELRVRDIATGRRPRRRRPRRLLRRRVGERQRDDPLHASRRRDAPVADRAARRRHRAEPTTSSCSRRTTTASTSASGAPGPIASS